MAIALNYQIFCLKFLDIEFDQHGSFPLQLSFRAHVLAHRPHGMFSWIYEIEIAALWIRNNNQRAQAPVIITKES
jgi:hypothetical protein